ncbi:MAG TPA: hypothetical protein VIY47_12120 [Ignavibacteriaceae bacterium]
MKKLMGILCTTILISSSLVAQTTKDKIDKAIKDPKREENAAKADVLIFDNKKISDTGSAVINQSTSPKKTAKKKSKKKNN